MKILKILKKVGLSILLGVVDSLPILPNIKKNLEAGEGLTAPGSLDIIRITTSIISVVLVIAFLMGKLSFEDLEKLLDYFK